MKSFIYTLHNIDPIYRDIIISTRSSRYKYFDINLLTFSIKNPYLLTLIKVAYREKLLHRKTWNGFVRSIIILLLYFIFLH